jgi:hypothetical protein
MSAQPYCETARLVFASWESETPLPPGRTRLPVTLSESSKARADINAARAWIRTMVGLVSGWEQRRPPLRPRPG